MTNAYTGAASDDGRIESKHAANSVSVWGAVALVIPLALQLGGIQLTGDETAQVGAGVQHAQDAFLHIMEVIGVIQMIIGRFNARQPLHFITPYAIDATSGKRIQEVEPLPLTSDVATIMDAHPLSAA